MSYRELGTGQVQSTDRPIIHFGSPEGSDYLPPAPEPEPPVNEPQPQPKPEKPPHEPKNPNRTKSLWRLFR